MHIRRSYGFYEDGDGNQYEAKVTYSHYCEEHGRYAGDIQFYPVEEFPNLIEVKSIPESEVP